MKITTQFAEKKIVESASARDMLPVKTGNARRGTVKFSYSIADVHSYWHSFLPSVGERIPWTMESTFAAQRGTFFDLQASRRGFGLLERNER